MEPPPPPRQNPPKDGLGPRGAPECYYTSRVLDSTARYVKFVKKLRALEDDQRKGAINVLKELKDKQYNDFFIRCDRRSLINKVARRVDLCMTSYEQDLMVKRQRLKDILAAEEETNIRKFVKQAQEGAEALWQEKKDRLAFLLAKRKKELEDKYSDIPLSKCVHVHPCIVAKRSLEAGEIHLYQMKEHQARKMAEAEFEKMWHEVSMKESEALAARMDMDAIEHRRLHQDCKQHWDVQVAMKKEQRKKEQEILKQEALKMKELVEGWSREEEADELKRQEKRKEMDRLGKDMIEERHAMLARQEADVKLINDTWDMAAGMSLNEEKVKEERRRQKEKELDRCNKNLMALKNDKVVMEAADNIALQQEAQRLQDKSDKQRCELLGKSLAASKVVRAGIVEQIKEKEAKKNPKIHDDYVEYQRQLSKQLDQLVAHKEMTNAQARKLYQTQLQEQVQYNQLLKERAKEEELQQRKKFEIAADQYVEDMRKMLCRPFFCDDIHPFMKRMYRDKKMRDRKCPCMEPDCCAVPVAAPKVSLKGAPKASSSKE